MSAGCGCGRAALGGYGRAGDLGGLLAKSNATTIPRGYPLGSPRPRVAMMLRCTSEVPPRIVAGTAAR